MKCYYEYSYPRKELVGIITPAEENYHSYIYLGENPYYRYIEPVKLKPYTTSNKIQLIPAILAAKMARLVRKIRNRKCTELENKLMRFYYEEEVRVRGYVE